MILRPRGQKLMDSVEWLVSSPHVNFETIEGSHEIKFKELRRKKASQTASRGSYNGELYVVKLRLFTDIKWEKLQPYWGNLMGRPSHRIQIYSNELDLELEGADLHTMADGFRYDFPVSSQPRRRTSTLPLLLYCDVYTQPALEAFQKSGRVVQQAPIKRDQRKILYPDKFLD